MAQSSKHSSEYFLDNFQVDDADVDVEENDKMTHSGSTSDAEDGDGEDSNNHMGSPFSSQRWPQSYK